MAPTQGMASVPWRLLPSMHDRPVVVTSSLSRWVHDSGYAGGSPAAVGVTAGPGLTRSRLEAAAIHRAWSDAGRLVRTGADGAGSLGSSAELVDLLGTCGVVHVAAHGVHEEQSPLFSSLRMTDGPVFAHEFPRPVAAEHVVLSACDVGRARASSGNESLGITSALISLGARSVVAAVAPVPDEVAATVMVRYHRLLATGVGAAEALTEASADRPDAAVFTVFGADWSARIPADDGVSQIRTRQGEAQAGVAVS